MKEGLLSVPPTVRITYIGGPTALIEAGGLRLLTDPTLDAAPHAYPTAAYTLYKTQNPALDPASLSADAVLLSHDHHFDNLDEAGRRFLPKVSRVLTTEEGARRLGGPAEGLAPWSTTELAGPGGSVIRVMATPARHGPAGGDRGPVIGFVLTLAEAPGCALYVSGDTVWCEEVAAVSRRAPVTVALLFMGAARVAAAGPSHLTFTAAEGVEAARAFPRALVVPLHFEGWAHFGEGRAAIEKAFLDSGLASRLQFPPAGSPWVVGWDGQTPSSPATTP